MKSSRISFWSSSMHRQALQVLSCSKVLRGLPCWYLIAVILGALFLLRRNMTYERISLANINLVCFTNKLVVKSEDLNYRSRKRSLVVGSFYASTAFFLRTLRSFWVMIKLPVTLRPLQIIFLAQFQTKLTRYTWQIFLRISVIGFWTFLTALVEPSAMIFVYF